MIFRRLTGLCVTLLFSATVCASPPRVATDISPVHSLVAQVMSGVAEPDLILPPGASPHGYSMRPSEAAALSRADLVFWIGEDLTPWLETPLDNLAGSARKVSLLEAPGTTLHAFREGATFESHEHDHDEHGHDEHGHEDQAHEDEHGHDDHAHKDEHGHDDHAHKDEHGHDEHDHDDHAHKDEHGHDDHAHKDEHGHDEHDHDDHAHKDEHGHDEHAHGDHDPHAWLDPENAKLWLQVIAAELSRLDAANASTYFNNANKASAELDALISTISEQTKALNDIKFVVFHDAYQYFERRFEVEATGAISIGDASDPSPARVAEIRDTVADLGVRCVFTEPQYNPEMVRSVFADTKVATIGVMDPLGTDIVLGEDHYTGILKAMVSSINQCKS